ncbi:MAG: ABC transporter ATP-binding protein [Saprospiraceae bacterium]|nr:ABC transporter ATP-binding protein [Saprospiraceae bacterium]
MNFIHRIFSSGHTALKVFIRAAGMAWQAGPGWAAAGVALNLAQAAIPLGVFYLTKQIIDDLVGALGTGNLETGNLLFFLVVLGGLWLAQGLTGTAGQWVQDILQLRFNDHIAGIIQKKSVEMDLSYYENPALQDTFHKAQYEAAYRPMQLLQAVQQLLQSIFFLVLVGVWLFSLSWWLVPVLTLAGLPALITRMYFAGRHFNLDRQRAQREREGWHLHALLTQDTAARELRLYGFGDALRARYRDLRAVLLREKRSLLSRQAGYDVLGQSFEVAALVALTGWTAMKALAGALSVGSLVMYLQAFQRGQAQLRSALSAMASLYGHRLFLNYLFDFLDLKPRVCNPEHPVALPAHISGGFQIENVSYEYPSNEGWVLQNINLRLPHGERIAVVGPNGSGKSTLIKLLARFYDPTQGQIRLDGIDLRHCAQEDLRQHIGIVFQDFYHYAFTAAENIAVSAIPQPPDEARLREAARKSGAANTIERLPAGYDTMLGHVFQNGVELSGGQWQQVAIARAFYADRDILILDEPMSAIDPLVEAAIFDELFAFDRNRTILFVTHRLYHLQRADRIIVLDKGRVAEQGAFAELMQARGLFYRLFSGQQVATAEQ